MRGDHDLNDDVCLSGVPSPNRLLRWEHEVMARGPGSRPQPIREEGVPDRSYKSEMKNTKRRIG